MRPVRFVTTKDGKSLAWTRAGSGPPLAKAATWITHLQHDAESPVWRHWIEFFESNFDYLRYDERGCGLSDHETGELGIENWADDLERVIEAAKIPEPFALLGISQGTGAAVRYAVKYPERVSHLILIGGYARGAFMRGNDRGADLYRAVINIFSAGFDEKNPAFREVFTRRFVQDGDPEKVAWFAELCRRSTDAKTGARLLEARGNMDVSDSLAALTCPTLILHARDDGVSPVSEGMFLAQHIPGAEFHVLDSTNHILQHDEPAWDEACSAILNFMGVGERGQDFGLTAREEAILSEICAAKSNKEIARSLEMSEKTVRNHATRIFAKLGVSTRQEAILKARGA